LNEFSGEAHGVTDSIFFADRQKFCRYYNS
jgi:hypothetical protein